MRASPFESCQRAAEWFAERGYPVHPVGAWGTGLYAKGTHPVWAPPGGSAGHTRATCDTSLIRRFWPSDAAPGVVPPEGCCLLDLDEKHRPGVVEETLRRWPALKHNGMHRTKSGGAHIPAALPPARHVVQSVNPTLGIDVRTAGKGYVVAPPALGYSVVVPFVCAEDLVLVPGDLADLLWPGKQRPSAGGSVMQRSARVQLGGRRLSRYVHAAIVGEVVSVARAVPGCRNSTLHRAAARLGTLVGAGCLDESAVWESLLLANARCTAPLEHIEAVRTIRSGLEWGVQHPRDIRTRVA